MVLGLFAAVIAASLAPSAGGNREMIFSCSIGSHRLEVTRQGEALTYSYGSAGKAELVLTGNPRSGTVFYHSRLYLHAEDQTLRFRRGPYSYVVYGHWEAPGSEGKSPERIEGGLLVVDGRRVVRARRCRSGGDMLEHPLFLRLPQDREWPIR